jgi:hypothetical protein
MRYLIATSWSRDSMWMSLAPPLQRVEDGGVDQLDDRRDVRVRRRELVDRERLVEFSSSATTSSAKPSVTSSSTRCDCSVFFSSSAICEASRP